MSQIVIPVHEKPPAGWQEQLAVAWGVVAG